MREQPDLVFSLKDEHKSVQDFKIKYNIWNAVSVGYAQYYSIVMRAITLQTCTIHVGALKHYAKSNNITKLLTEH